MAQKFVKIDEEGYWQFADLRVQDENLALELFSALKKNEFGALATRHQGEDLFVEAFDEAFVVTGIERQRVDSAGTDNWLLHMPYGYHRELQISPTGCPLTLDEWDRFHGTFSDGLGFVFNRAAQAQFFDQLDDFDDTGIFVGSERIEIPNWLQDSAQADTADFWSSIYQNEKPRWELDQPTPILTEALPQLKLTRRRILVAGCGSGNDAAFLAQAGHLVTAVDLSPEAIRQARAKYGQMENLRFEVADIFHPAPKQRGQYDLIFEHTCFCAINAARRHELVHIWKTLLTEQGSLLGIFFVHPKYSGPPYGGSEWELRQRLKKDFRFLYWTRWRQSLERRRGKELVIYAEKF